MRLLPIRALPVPFWAYGFLPPPRTSARVFVLAVPCSDANRNVKTGAGMSVGKGEAWRGDLGEGGIADVHSHNAWDDAYAPRGCSVAR